VSTAAVPPAFVHDLNTCVGCHACLLACANENGLEPGRSWRQIVSFNEGRRPGLPVFHLSLACNHCLDAPCLQQCPARAIARDPLTGAVLLDGALCIGCRYCAWVCPYDAPRYDPARGVMEKCTLCNERLLVGLAPACCGLCPTGALRLGEYGGESTPSVPGFPETGIRPAIRFVPLRPERRDGPPMPAPLLDEASYRPLATTERSKVSLRSEWSLAAFTSGTVLLVAAFAASHLGGPRLSPAVFLGLAFAALATSAAHLGQPLRAWRAGLNWRGSWLSREVLAWSAFVATAGATLLAPGRPAIPVAAILGFVCLSCVDRVYAILPRERRSRLDDVTALLGGVFLTGVLAGSAWLFLPAGLLRLAGSFARFRARESADGTAIRITGLRVLVGLVLPAALWLFGEPLAARLAALGALVGEILDRVDFYAALRIITPRSHTFAAAVSASTRARLPRARADSRA
jgi:Fe-S-cluster-containing dehydrogenase component/DMSO reductase anchor subunit